MAIKRSILILGLLAPLLARGVQTTAELQFGFPSLLGVNVSRTLRDNWRVGIGFGALPTFAVTPFFNTTITADISDDYNIMVDPSVQVLTVGTSVQWNPWSSPSFFRFEILANIVDATAKTYIVNKATRAKASYLDLEVTALLPRLVASFGTRIAKFENWEMVLGGGLTFMLGKQILAQKTGLAAAYFDAVPTAQDSANDGFAQMESSVNTMVSNSLFCATVLPAFWISASW